LHGLDSSMGGSVNCDGLVHSLSLVRIRTWRKLKLVLVRTRRHRRNNHRPLFVRLVLKPEQNRNNWNNINKICSNERTVGSTPPPPLLVTCVTPWGTKIKLSVSRNEKQSPSVPFFLRNYYQVRHTALTYSKKTGLCRWREWRRTLDGWVTPNQPLFGP
jgi:hypothetical protein